MFHVVINIENIPLTSAEADVAYWLKYAKAIVNCSAIGAVSPLMPTCIGHFRLTFYYVVQCFNHEGID